MMRSVLSACVIFTLLIQGSDLEPPCTTPLYDCPNAVVDIVFILDSSASMRYEQFQQMLMFLNEFVLHINIDGGNARVGVITFGEVAQVKFYLSQYQIKKDLRDAIGGIKHQNGLATNTGEALKMIREEMFTTAHGDRPDVLNFAILITDGYSQLKDNTLNEAELSREAGIHIFAIGIAEDYLKEDQLEELMGIASKPAKENILMYRNFYDLSGSRDKICTALLKRFRFTSDMPMPSLMTACRNVVMDLVFIIENLTSEDSREFQLTTKFISNFVGRFNINGGNVRVGIITYNGDVQVEFFLNEHKTKQSLLNAINYSPRPPTTIFGIEHALEKMRDMFTAAEGDRPDVPNVAILVIQSDLNFGGSYDQAKLTRDRGIRIYAIGVGLTDVSGLAKIINEPVEENLFQVYNVSELINMSNEVCTSLLNHVGFVARAVQGNKTDEKLSSGRLEILYNGTWNTVCREGFGKNEAQVACRMLGFNGTEAITVSSVYGAGSGRILPVYLQCQGNEVTLVQCIKKTFCESNCSHSDDVEIVCNAAKQIKVRLTNETKGVGRLQIYFNGDWNNVCGRRFGKTEAKVVCRILGFNSTEAVAKIYRRGSEKTVQMSVNCRGTEKNLAECTEAIYNNYLCEEEVGIMCILNVNLKPRLAGGMSEGGRLEILFQEEWNTVCGNNFGANEAQVVCKMLGFNSTGAVVVPTAVYGNGTGKTLPIYFKCQGTESYLTECIDTTYSSYICDHSKDYGVICNSNIQLKARLVHGTARWNGRLEMLDHGIWSTVCDNGFGKEEAHVACKMLGFNSFQAVEVRSYMYGEGSGTILFDNVNCQGNESSLDECDHSDYYNTSCRHNKDVGIMCLIRKKSSPVFSSHTIDVSLVSCTNTR